MAWLETASETFVARHDERDSEDAQRVLAQLEHARPRLQRRLGAEVGELAVVLHPTSAQLDAAQPWLPLQRARTAPAARRYVVGRVADGELHVLAPRVLAGPRVQRRGLARAADARPHRPARQAPADARGAPRPPGRAGRRAVAARGRRAVLLRPDAPHPPRGGAAHARAAGADLSARAPRRAAARRHRVRPAGARGGRGGVRRARPRARPGPGARARVPRPAAAPDRAGMALAPRAARAAGC